MKTEIEYASNFVAVTTKDKLQSSDCQIEKLKERLIVLLGERFEGHWYPDKPIKGSAYRCININIDENSVDAVLRQAFVESEFTVDEMLNVFDKGLALWIDPNDVCCKLGRGAIFPIYRKIMEKKVDQNHSNVIGMKHKQRPQQRPRSISPPQPTMIPQQQSPQFHRSRSTTPPGFTSLDAGQLYQNIAAPTTYYSVDNLPDLWETIPNSTAYTPSHRPTVSTSSSSHRSYGNNDAVYSFNQYSSYYKPNTSYWKKNVQHKQQTKPVWQNDEVYQRYHWSKREGSAKFQNYASFTTSRLPQEVY